MGPKQEDGTEPHLRPRQVTRGEPSGSTGTTRRELGGVLRRRSRVCLALLPQSRHTQRASNRWEGDRPSDQIHQPHRSRGQVVRSPRPVIGVWRIARSRMRQHYVPRFYLQLFIDLDGQPIETDFLWEVHLPTGQIRRKAPKNAAWRTDYYTLPDVEPAIAQPVEAGLSQVEGVKRTDHPPDCRRRSNAFWPRPRRTAVLSRPLGDPCAGLSESHRKELAAPAPAANP